MVAVLVVLEEVPLLPPEETGPAAPVSKLAPWPPLLEKAGGWLRLSSSDAHPATRHASTQCAKRGETTQGLWKAIFMADLVETPSL